MTGDEAAFTKLDKENSGLAKFGDSSLVGIKGHDTILFAALDTCLGVL